MVEERPGFFSFRAEGEKASEIFADEPGGHRWQRKPPNDKRDRVHTSTITVAVLPIPSDDDVKILPEQLEWTTTRGSGPGGQNRNKVETCVIVKHKPTGIMIRSESERSQFQNRRLAFERLKSRLWEMQEEKQSAEIASVRKQMVGGGARGDKRRTIRTQDGQVNDHITGKRWNLRNYLKGDWD